MATIKELSLLDKLIKIQGELKAPKNQKAKQYSYRSCEDILEALKPLLKTYEVAILLSDEPVVRGERFYIKAVATLKNGDGEEICSTAYAREDEKSNFMSSSQLTGSASSYARKYALNGLFAIDDNRDADTFDAQGMKEPAKATSNYEMKSNAPRELDQNGLPKSKLKMEFETYNQLVEIYGKFQNWYVNQCKKHGWDSAKTIEFTQEQGDTLINDFYIYRDQQRAFNAI